MVGEHWTNGLGFKATVTVEGQGNCIERGFSVGFVVKVTVEDQGHYVERGFGVTATATAEQQVYCIE